MFIIVVFPEPNVSFWGNPLVFPLEPPCGQPVSFMKTISPSLSVALASRGSSAWNPSMYYCTASIGNSDTLCITLVVRALYVCRTIQLPSVHTFFGVRYPHTLAIIPPKLPSMKRTLYAVPHHTSSHSQVSPQVRAITIHHVRLPILVSEHC